MRGFTLIDVLIATVLTSLLVVLLSKFAGEMLQYSTYMAKHQQIRAEGFALVSNALASIVREASAIDYKNTTESKLSLFMDKLEEKKVSIFLSPSSISTADDISQLVVRSPSNKDIYLNSQKTVIEKFNVAVSTQPKKENKALFAQQRTVQPMVRIKITARHQRLEGARARPVFAFFEDPRVSYEAAYALRNYSFSSLRSL